MTGEKLSFINKLISNTCCFEESRRRMMMKLGKVWGQTVDLMKSASLVAVVVLTLITIYYPLWSLKPSTQDNIIGLFDDDVSAADDVRTSFVCVIAGAASLVLDIVMEFGSMLTGSSEATIPKIGARIMAVFIILWPSFHVLWSPRSLSIPIMLSDGLMQLYAGLVLVLYSLLERDKKTKWSWKVQFTAMFSVSFAIWIFIVQLSHGTHSAGWITVQYFCLGAAVIVVAVRAKKSIAANSEDSMVVFLLLFFFALNSVMVALVQSSFQWPQHIPFYDVKTAANYLMVAGCTFPAVMSARMEKERARCIEKIDDFRKSFLRYISHEIRTPLNVSTVGVAILEDVLQGKEMLVGEVGEIVEQTKRSLGIATEILNDLLTFEKINANAMVLERTMQRPVDFVLASVCLFEFQARDKGISLMLPVESPQLEDSWINVDTYKLSQVMRNLLSNALKFTSNGGIIKVVLESVHKEVCDGSSRSQSKKGRVASTSPTSEWLRISVIDSGCGIAEDNIGKLFKEIIQFDANKLQAGKGTGLGMFISRGIVDLHGGSIAVTSEGLGRGTTFSVDLPLFRHQLFGEDSNSSKNGSSKHPGPGLLVSSTVSSRGQYLSIKTFNLDDSGCAVVENSAPSPVRELKSNPMDESDESHYAVTSVTSLGVTLTQPSQPSQPAEPIQQTPAAHWPLVGSIPKSSPAKSSRYSSSTSSYFDDPNKEPASSRLSSLCSKRTPPHSVHAVDKALPVGVLNDIESGSATSSLPPSVSPSVRPSVSFPLAQDSKDKPQSSSQFSTIDLRDCRVLIVDDSQMNVKMMSLMFKKFGAKCIESALNGEEAVKLVVSSLAGKGSPIDMVLMDNNMDVMTGPQACKRMRGAGYQNPIFGLTGDVSEAADKEYLAAGANRIFRKPLRLQEIMDALTQCSL
jgi:signal transduction histidine kinase